MGVLRNSLGAAAIGLSSVFAAAADDLKPYAPTQECAKSAIKDVFKAEDSQILKTEDGVGVWVNLGSDSGQSADVSSTISIQSNGLVGAITVQANISNEAGGDVSSQASLDYQDPAGTTLNIPDTDRLVDTATRSMVLKLDRAMRECAPEQVMGDASPLRGPNPFKLG